VIRCASSCGQTAQSKSLYVVKGSNKEIRELRVK